MAAAAHGEGKPEARRWGKSLWEQLRSRYGAKVIRRVEQLDSGYGAGDRETVVRERQYFKNHRGRLDSGNDGGEGLAVDSWAMEASYRQYLGWFKPRGQFWGVAGDKA